MNGFKHSHETTQSDIFPSSYIAIAIIYEVPTALCANNTYTRSSQSVLLFIYTIALLCLYNKDQVDAYRGWGGLSPWEMYVKFGLKKWESLPFDKKGVFAVIHLECKFRHHQESYPPSSPLPSSYAGFPVDT